MIKITDEILMRFADGELNKKEMTQVEKALAENGSLREKVTRHHALRKEFELAFNDIDNTEMPAEITNNLQEDNTNVVSITAHLQNKKWLRQSAIAASIMAAFIIGMFSTDTIEDKGGFLAINNQVAHLLDTMPSGTSMAGIKMQASFLTDDGNLCRTFKTLSEDVANDGFSCRDINGHWEVIALLPGIPKNAYVPASGEAGGVINQLTDKMKTLSANEEKMYLKE